MRTFSRGLIFDLDDTLYLERDFVLSGFAAVGAWWRQKTGQADFAARCARIFDAGIRGQIFDLALSDAGGDPDPLLVAQLVAVYREHQPSISLASDVARYLRNLRDDEFVGIITDGPALTQRAKIKALGLEEKGHLILCTDAWGIGYRKPHPRAFEAIESASRLPVSRLIYVADNATKDFVTPRARGWKTVQILRPERVHQGNAPTPLHKAQSQIFTFDDLEQALRDFPDAF